MLVARGQQRAGPIDGGGYAQRDSGQVAEIGGWQRALVVGGEDDRAVELAGPDPCDRVLLPCRILWQLMPRVHPGSLVDHYVVDVRVEPTYLRADFAGEQGEMRIR